MKFSVKILFITFLVSSTLLSCQKQKDATTVSTGKDDTTIATVNGKPVTAEEVRFEISLLPENLQEMATTGEGLSTLLDDVLKKEMLYQEAKKENIDRTDEYKRRLHDLEKRLIVEMLLVQEVEKKTSVSDQEAKQFYEDNRDRFVNPKQGSKGKEEPVPLEQVKDLIKDRLLQQKQRAAFQDYLESLSKNYKIDIKKDAIEKAFGIPVGDDAESLENTPGSSKKESMEEKVIGEPVPESKDSEKSGE